MYPVPFRYHRASSLAEAVSMLSDLGEEAKVLAGGQSLIPLMKFRLAAPTDLVDLNAVPNISFIRQEGNAIRIGTLARHADIESSQIAARVPLLVDCASGIADVQVRNRGTVGGSLAEADPSGDWGVALLALNTRVCCIGPDGDRTIALPEFLVDAYTTALQKAELVHEIVVEQPPERSGGAYIAFKRSAQVYASATAGVQLTMEDSETCKDARIFLGCVGLAPIHATEAESELRGNSVTAETIEKAAQAAMAAADPQPDMRGSAEYKRILVRALVKRAIDLAVRRSRGEQVEGSHYYA